MKNRYDAPIGQIPKPGEAWLPVGNKAAAAAFYLVKVDAVRDLVPPELPIVEVWPGKTVAGLFLGDYGPGSTLEFSELGVQPALVRCHTGLALWSSRILVNSPKSLAGGQPLGFAKQLASFTWHEERAGNRRSGRCLIAQGDTPVLEISYREGALPLPSFPSRLVTLKDDVLFSSFHHLRGKYRLSQVEVRVPDGSPLAYVRDFGKPLFGVVVRDLHGRMGDGVLASFLPHRNPARPVSPEDQRTADLDTSSGRGASHPFADEAR